MAADLHLGVKPRPSALFYGFEEGELEAVHSLFPEYRYLYDLSSVRQQEWDCVITESSPINVIPPLNVLAFGSDALCAEAGGALLGVSAMCTSEQLIVSGSVRSEIQALVRRDLVPSAEKRSTHWYVGSHSSYTGAFSSAVYAPTVEPFLRAGSGHVLAGSFKRNGDMSECWFLPEDADREAWIRLAVSVWRETYPERFPTAHEWRTDDRWATPAQRTARATKSRLQQELEQQASTLLAGIHDAEADLERATAGAEADEWRLVRVKGQALVDVIAECLRYLGFEVLVVDHDEGTTKGDLLEDLRITHPARVGWEVLAEVRGHEKSGAAVGDLGRINRFVGRYEALRGQPPSGAWYMVNQFYERMSPSERPEMLASNPVERGQFIADLNGALIDTADLLALWLACLRAEITREEVARTIVELRGVLRADDVLMRDGSSE
ncbi:MAG: hypothetical protein JF603_10775 [Acidobacteria bacterium]|nr:hypothetical protein [Acidobacteriota bacterium]